MERIPDLEYGGITASGEAQPAKRVVAPMRRVPGSERLGPPGAEWRPDPPAAALLVPGMNARRGMAIGATALVGLGAAPADAASCGQPGYAYAGVLGSRPASSVAATVAAVRASRVESGHVAAWIGVGGAGAGRGGTDAWLQAGLVARSGGGHVLYAEWKRPGTRRRYVAVRGGVRVGEPHRLLVRELPGRPSVWRAYVDGRPASPPVRLPGSHGRLPGAATAESWDGGRPACNRFAYRFEGVTMTGGEAPIGLLVLEDPGYRIESRERATFVARSRR